MKLIGKISGVSLTLKGDLLLTLECEGKPDITITDKRLSVEIKEYKEKRSVDANAYAWVLIGKIAEKLNRKKIDVYRDYIRDIGSFTTVCVQERRSTICASCGKIKDLGGLRRRTNLK